jgi:hypothetical protein
MLALAAASLLMIILPAIRKKREEVLVGD